MVEVEIAKAIVEFDNVDLQKIKGLKSSKFADALGYISAVTEVCHRDNVILTAPPPSPPPGLVDAESNTRDGNLSSPELGFASLGGLRANVSSGSLASEGESTGRVLHKV